MRHDPDWTGIMLDGPEAHGLEVCHHCNGYVSSLKEEADRWTRCGRTGLVRLGHSASRRGRGTGQAWANVGENCQHRDR
jgi:hypothetical protein